MQPVVLLLDDDADFLELERKIFETKGYEVRSFSDPKTALSALGKGLPAGVPSGQPSRKILIVCDLMMEALDSGLLVCPRRED